MTNVIIKTTDSWHESVVSLFEQNGFERYRPGGINTIGFLYLGRRFKFELTVNKKNRFRLVCINPSWISEHIHTHGMECHIDVDGIKEKYDSMQKRLSDLKSLKRVMQFKSDMLVPYITDSLMSNENIADIRKLNGCTLKDFAMAFSISLGTEHSKSKELLNDRTWISERIKIYNDSGDNINLLEPINMHGYLEICQKSYSELSDNDLDNTPFKVTMYFSGSITNAPRFNYSDKLSEILKRINEIAEQLRTPDSKISEDIKFKYSLYEGLKKNKLSYDFLGNTCYSEYIKNNLGYIIGSFG